jgi:hypothetical protein
MERRGAGRGEHEGDTTQGYVQLLGERFKTRGREDVGRPQIRVTAKRLANGAKQELAAADPIPQEQVDHVSPFVKGPGEYPARFVL